MVDDRVVRGFFCSWNVVATVGKKYRTSICKIGELQFHFLSNCYLKFYLLVNIKLKTKIKHASNVVVKLCSIF